MSFPGRLTTADLVTAFRALLVVALAALIGRATASTSLAWMGVGLATLAALLDGVDGWLARRHGNASAFGARFDMETDAVLILVLSLLAWRWGKAGAWVLLSGLMRYLFVGAARFLPWLNGPLTPTLRGKTVAVIQMVGLIVAIGPIVPVPISTLSAAIALGLLIWSFAVDVHRLWRERRIVARGNVQG